MTDRPRVVVTRGLPRPWLDELEQSCDLVVGAPDPAGWQPAVLEALPDAVGLLTMLTERVDEAILDAAPRLRVVSNMAVGVDNIDLEACARRNVRVGHTPGATTEATADLTWALLLGAARRITAAGRDAAEGRWTTWSATGWLGVDLHRSTLGVVGMGKIGRAVARRAVGFGMEVLYTTRSTTGFASGTRVELSVLLEQSDFVTLHVPLTPQTHHLIDARALARMRDDAILVNTARGPVVDTAALVHALQRGSIRGAALDVTDPEPLPPSHPLYRLPNCLITPHIGSATEVTRRTMARLAVENVLAGVQDRALPYPVKTRLRSSE